MELQPLTQDLLPCLLEPALRYEEFRREYPEIEVIGLVGYDSQRQQFVLVELPVGEPELSEREQEVLKLVARGCTNFQIAQGLAIAENTVKTHLQNIFAKLQVQSRTEAAMYATRRGWVMG